MTTSIKTLVPKVKSGPIQRPVKTFENVEDKTRKETETRLMQKTFTQNYPLQFCAIQQLFFIYRYVCLVFILKRKSKNF